MSATPKKKREAGMVMIMLGMFIFGLLFFIAAGIELGRWYLVRAELAKSTDAAALIAARNISNPNVDFKALALEYANANFPAGSLGTANGGAGAPSFALTMLAPFKVQVTGGASTGSIFAQILDDAFKTVSVHALSVSLKRPVEIMLVLDRSGSMGFNGGQPMNDLKAAANNFVEFFRATQADDKMGLISFATGVTVDHALSNNFADAMKASINAMTANDWTNAEDGIDQADGPQGLTAQNGIPPEDRIAEFLVFFTDGRANSFRQTFVRAGVTIDGVVTEQGSCEPGSQQQQGLGNALSNPTTGATISNSNPWPTGDGKATGSKCGSTTNTHWLIMDTYPIQGYTATSCSIPEYTVMSPYVCNMAEQLALLHAQELKDAGVTVYSIGLGDPNNPNAVNDNFLKQIASSTPFYYKAPTSADLQGIFQHIALEIKLRLVQ